MNPPKPHFLLFCEGNHSPQEFAAAPSNQVRGNQVKNSRWRFVLENVTTGEKFDANDLEAGCTPDRASLIAVLRGLEALEQPSKVTLVTNNRYVFRGLRYGLTEWRDNDFAWEHFGGFQPIRNADIWRRIDRTLSYHEVQCRWMSMGDPQKSNHSDSGEIKLGASPSLGALPSIEVIKSISVVESQLVSVSCSPKDLPREHRRATTVYKDSSASDCNTPPSKDRSLEGALDSNLNAIEQAVQLNDHTCESLGQTEPRPNASEREAGERDREDQGVEIPTIGNLGVQGPESGPVEVSLAKGEDLTDEPVKGLSPRTVLFYPFAIGWSICKRSLLAVWEAILRLDEGIESYLRCMLLLDPRQYRRRK